MFHTKLRFGIAALAVLFMCGQSLAAIHIHADDHNTEHSFEHNSDHSSEHKTEHNTEHNTEHSSADDCSFCIQADKTPSILALQSYFVHGFDGGLATATYAYQANSAKPYSAFQSRAPPITQ